MDYDDKYFNEVFVRICEEESKCPSIDDRWNSSISKITKFKHVQVASFVTPITNINEINMMIIVLPGTTRQDIIDDWQEIIEYRNLLSGLYGKLKNNKSNYRHKVLRLHRDFMMGYGTIAKFLNYQIVLWLLNSKALERKSQMHEAAYYEKAFIELLAAFGYSESEAGENLNSAKEELQKGMFPWHYRDGPFNRMRVRNHLREFIKEDTIGWLERIQFLEDYVFCNQIEKLARELFAKRYTINKSDKKFFQEGEKIRGEILNEIIENLKESIFPGPPDMSFFNSILP